MRCPASACGARRKYVFVLRVRSIGLAIRASRAILLGLLLLLCNNECAAPELQGSANPLLRPFNSLKILSDSSLRRRASTWSDVGASEISQWSTQTDSLRQDTPHKRSTAPFVTILPSRASLRQQDNKNIARTERAEFWCACLNQVAGLHIEVPHFAQRAMWLPFTKNHIVDLVAVSNFNLVAMIGLRFEEQFVFHVSMPAGKKARAAKIEHQITPAIRRNTNRNRRPIELDCARIFRAAFCVYAVDVQKRMHAGEDGFGARGRMNAHILCC
jgi:hypothetical protein